MMVPVVDKTAWVLATVRRRARGLMFCIGGRLFIHGRNE